MTTSVPFRGGQGSYARLIANVRPLLAMQRTMQVSARVTVTPDNLRLQETLDQLLALGFHSVGFSPMLHAPSAAARWTRRRCPKCWRQMIECGEEFERRTARRPALRLLERRDGDSGDSQRHPSPISVRRRRRLLRRFGRRRPVRVPPVRRGRSGAFRRRLERRRPGRADRAG